MTEDNISLLRQKAKAGGKSLLVSAVVALEAAGREATAANIAERANMLPREVGNLLSQHGIGERAGEESIGYPTYGGVTLWKMAPGVAAAIDDGRLPVVACPRCGTHWMANSKGKENYYCYDCGWRSDSYSGDIVAPWISNNEEDN